MLLPAAQLLIEAATLKTAGVDPAETIDKAAQAFVDGMEKANEEGLLDN